MCNAEFNGLSSEIYRNVIASYGVQSSDISKGITWCNLHAHG